MVWEFNEALTLSHVRSMTFMVSSFTWYNQLVVHINAPIFFFFAINHHLKPGYPLKASFAEVNHSHTPVIHFGCHQPKLIDRCPGHPFGCH